MRRLVLACLVAAASAALGLTYVNFKNVVTHPDGPSGRPGRVDLVHRDVRILMTGTIVANNHDVFDHDPLGRIGTFELKVTEVDWIAPNADKQLFEQPAPREGETYVIMYHHEDGPPPDGSRMRLDDIVPGTELTVGAFPLSNDFTDFPNVDYSLTFSALPQANGYTLVGRWADQDANVLSRAVGFVAQTSRAPVVDERTVEVTRGQLIAAFAGEAAGIPDVIPENGHRANGPLARAETAARLATIRENHDPTWEELPAHTRSYDWTDLPPTERAAALQRSLKVDIDDALLDRTDQIVFRHSGGVLFTQSFSAGSHIDAMLIKPNTTFEVFLAESANQLGNGKVVATVPFSDLEAALGVDVSFSEDAGGNLIVEASVIPDQTNARHQNQPGGTSR